MFPKATLVIVVVFVTLLATNPTCITKAFDAGLFTNRKVTTRYNFPLAYGNQENTHKQENDRTRNDKRKFELWLDLRGTRLSPVTALELWSIEEQQSCVSRDNFDELQPFVKCLVSTKAEQFDYALLKFLDDAVGNETIELMFLGDEECADNNSHAMPQKIIEYSTISKESIVSGRLFSLVTSPSSSTVPMLPDPLPVIEAATQGKWVVLDTIGWENLEEEERISLVFGLVELITSVAAENRGGIGLTCRSSTEVAKIAMRIQSIVSGSSGKKTAKCTESGILIPNDACSSMDIVTEDREEELQSKFSIIVPFDMKLIRTALMLM
mmetsp:Transcript_2335/g.5034  ORF Transcript_2335/g.5034 Transcript_2335/m.5034 type:complete len:325 (+) Transcript_2335:37-1011(+)